MIRIPSPLLALLCVVPFWAFPVASQETPQGVSETQAQIDAESDLAAIDSIWQSFKAAVLSGDKVAAVRHFSPHKRDGADAKFELMGSEFSEWPKSWSELTPISIGADIALYTFTQSENDGERTYSVYFVRHPDYGWLLLQL